MVDVTGAVTIAGEKDGVSGISSRLETGAIGKGGDITISSGSFSLTNGAQLDASTSGQGQAGSIFVRAIDSVSLADANIFSTVQAPGVGKGGNITISSGSFSLTDGAQLVASTFGEGNAGTIQINAVDSISISGTSSTYGFSNALFTFTNSSGRGGDIAINTRTFSVSNGAVLDARTTFDGNGGDITVSANRVEVLNGGQLLSTASGSGGAGKITVNATDSVIVNGTDATFNDRVAQFPTRVPNQGAASGLFVRSESSGSAGDIEVTSPQIRLDNSGRFIAESALGNGGNIKLLVGDLLLLRRGSLISTNAGTAQQGGNGGNITINAPNGFIVAVPNENSDISANAYTGSGGRVQINAFGIYGTQFRDQENPLTSDITASSVFGAEGTVELNTPDIDPNSGLVNLPSVPVETKVAQGCYAGGNEAKSEFIITGRGGLPPNPGDALTTDAVLVNLITVKPKSDNRNSPTVSKIPTTPTPEPIVEATGWVRNEKGEVILTANPPSNTPHSSWFNPVSCTTRREAE